MKITKTLAALCVLGAGLMAITSCKDSSGDMAVTGAVSGVPAKYALEVTVDATGDEIKVGKKAISDSNEGTEVEIVENTVEGKTTPAGHETEQQQCGKRAFKEISSGLNNNCGFRTNIVLDTTKGTWLNSETSRKANVGMLFDFKQYNGKFDFFYISFVPQFSGSSVTGVTCYFERYSEVKKYGKGIYTRHPEASCLGKNFIPTDSAGTWDNTLYPPSADKSYPVPLVSGSDYYVEDGKIIIGLNVKQYTPGIYTIETGKILYDVGGEPKTFTPKDFKQSWKTKFASGSVIAEGGDNEIGSSIVGYSNWSHVDSSTKDSNLIGGVMAYSFAPYGTKPVACFYTCSTSAEKTYTDNETSQVDYVGDWNVANELDTSDEKSTIIYEDGNVIHEYYQY